jgi:hypothetical protein
VAYIGGSKNLSREKLIVVREPKAESRGQRADSSE